LVSKTALVPSFLRVTVEPPMTAAEESTTSPWRREVVPWGKALKISRRKASKTLETMFAV
jgi:hypothetical protein